MYFQPCEHLSDFPWRSQGCVPSRIATKCVPYSIYKVFFKSGLNWLNLRLQWQCITSNYTHHHQQLGLSGCFIFTKSLSLKCYVVFSSLHDLKTEYVVIGVWKFVFTWCELLLHNLFSTHICVYTWTWTLNYVLFVYSPELVSILHCCFA